MEENLLMLMLHRCQEWVSMISITSRFVDPDNNIGHEAPEP